MCFTCQGELAAANPRLGGQEELFMMVPGRETRGLDRWFFSHHVKVKPDQQVMPAS